MKCLEFFKLAARSYGLDLSIKRHLVGQSVYHSLPLSLGKLFLRLRFRRIALQRLLAEPHSIHLALFKGQTPSSVLELILLVVPVLLHQGVDSRSLIIGKILSSPHYRQFR